VRHTRLKVLEDPGPKVILEKDDGKGTVFASGRLPDTDSALSWDCGRCSAPLIVGAEPGVMEGVVLRCADCGALNITP
jgi:hypothetical protein